MGCGTVFWSMENYLNKRVGFDCFVITTIANGLSTLVDILKQAFTDVQYILIDFVLSDSLNCIYASVSKYVEYGVSVRIFWGRCVVRIKRYCTL